MRIYYAVLAILLSFSTQAFANTRIAFLELYDHKGNLIQYEPNGRFVHTAIQFDDIGELWLNAYPGEGVALITLEKLQKRGQIAEIIEIPQSLSLEQVDPYMGRPFDFKYSWTDDALYCTELIGKLLNIPTHPMRFNKKQWPPSYWELEGLPGLSPDGLYTWALAQNSGKINANTAPVKNTPSESK